jgi:hypothetical protein
MQPIIEPSRMNLAASEFRIIKNVGKEPDVGFDSTRNELPEGAAQSRQRLPTIATRCDQFG